MKSAVESTARSQSSSFDESSTGENSSRRYPPAKITRLSRNELQLGDITPSTSFSNPSSQEHLSEDLLDPPYKLPLLHVGDSPNLRPRPVLLEEKDSSPPNASSINAPNKRMADGNAKYVGQSLPGIPLDVDPHRNLEGLSATFKNSPIGEVGSLTSFHAHHYAD